MAILIVRVALFCFSLPRPDRGSLPDLPRRAPGQVQRCVTTLSNAQPFMRAIPCAIRAPGRAFTRARYFPGERVYPARQPCN
jgi:hypothetical protein